MICLLQHDILFIVRPYTQHASRQLFSVFYHHRRAPPWSSGSVLVHRSLPFVFESRLGHIWRLFRLSLRLITFGSRSAHLAYHVHKSGRKTSIIIIIYHHRQLMEKYTQKLQIEGFHNQQINSYICRSKHLLHGVMHVVIHLVILINIGRVYSQS